MTVDVDRAFANLPSLKLNVPWGYEPTGPYVVMKAQADLQFVDDLTDAVREFARLAMPVHSTLCAYVADRDGVVVVGYYNSGMSPVEWFGIHEAFALLYLQPFLEVLEVTLAEEAAKRRVGAE
jgi:hypothetical protein